MRWESFKLFHIWFLSETWEKQTKNTIVELIIFSIIGYNNCWLERRDPCRALLPSITKIGIFTVRAGYGSLLEQPISLLILKTTKRLVYWIEHKVEVESPVLPHEFLILITKPNKLWAHGNTFHKRERSWPHNRILPLFRSRQVVNLK